MATERIPGPALATERPEGVRLRGVILWAARVAWVTLVGAILALSVIGFGPGLRSVQQGADDEAIVSHQVVMSGLAANHIPGSVFVVFDMGGMLVILGAAVGCGAFIFWKRSDDLVALLLSLALISQAAMIGVFLSNLAEVSPGLHAAGVVLGSIGIMLLFPLMAVFPDGRLKPRWVIIPILGWVAVVLIYIVVNVTSPGSSSSSDTSTALETIIAAVCLLAPLLSFPAAMIYRYRRLFSPEQRQQTKLVVYASVLLVLSLVLNYLVGMLTHDFWLTQRGSVLPALVEAAGMLITLPGLVGLPLAVVFAMQRYRLWDVDFLINRSLVVGGLTLLLVIGFVVAFLGLNAALGGALGQGHAELAASASTLILVVLFTPARKQVTRFVDRRFYGIQLDYADVVRKKAAPAVPIAGQTHFGDYQGLRLIGRGGMGEVYRAQHPTLGRAVAIKILPARYVPDENARQRFLREAQLIARLKHPNIVAIYDFGEQDDVPYMVMEYIDGPDLGSVLRTRGSLPPDEALPLLGDIAAALDFIHQNGIVHRDVKPSNILIQKVTTAGEARPGRAVLTDFGISRVLESASQLTQGGMIGTLDYISPEQIQGASRVDTRADIYSFGVLAFHVLTGQLPFQHASPGAMVLAHMMAPPPDPRSLNPALPQSAAGALARAMAKRPELRFPTAGDFVAALA